MGNTEEDGARKNSCVYEESGISVAPTISFQGENIMSFGWVDPDSVQMDEERALLADFYKADSGKRLVLRIPVEQGDRLDGLLAAQAENGIVFLNKDMENLNAAETVRGTVFAENRTSGEAVLSDGRKLAAEFPAGAFDEEGRHAFRGTGVVEHETINIFAADTIYSPDPSHSPGP